MLMEVLQLQLSKVKVSVFREQGQYENFYASVHNFMPGMLELANPEGVSNKNEYFEICEIFLEKGLQANVKMDKQMMENHN